MAEAKEEEQTEEQEEDRDEGEGKSEETKDFERKQEAAREEIKELEEADQVPTNLEDWPTGKAKYLTFGGPDAGDPYDDGPTAKLGPSNLERHSDGSVVIDGEPVDNPEDHKGEPIPGGPTDPNAPKLAGEAGKGDTDEDDSDDGDDSGSGDE